MSSVSESERVTQDRVVRLFNRELGYTILGNWERRAGNSNVEIDLLLGWLLRSGVDRRLAEQAVDAATRAAGDQSAKLFDVNKSFYTLLRYGASVQPAQGKNKITVNLIDWNHPQENDFAVAEEVTVEGNHTKRPDIVLYVNGIALGVLELKRSTVSVTEGIRQNLDNQQDLFIAPFFSTVQLVMAGNDVEGIAYGAIETKETYFLRWKEVSEKANPDDKYLLKITKQIRLRAGKQETLLDRNIVEMLNKDRFLEIIHDFIVFDRGIKKICRPNQYFGVNAAQDFIRRGEGGIIWHTQGSGKSLTMVWLAKWVREHNHRARILIVTDREELDWQIEKIFTGVDETIYRTTSGRDLLEKLNEPNPWLMCSLIHKFGGKEEGDVDSYLEDIKRSVPKEFMAKGEVLVFVDECHRSQSGKLHKAMSGFLPNALFIGFTGTPLLKTDKQTSRQIFGRFIHVYRFDEAVQDGVILDLRYEARDIEQKLTSPEKIDQWFEMKTRGLTETAKGELKEKWGTIKKLFSSKARLEKIVLDIIFDMERKERLKNGRGNALLVSDSIYNACRYYELFLDAGFDTCAIVTSFVPSYTDIRGEQTGEGYTERLQRFDIYRKMLADYFKEDPDEAMKKVEIFEKEVKKRFVEEPARMRFLIVVNKLLTGFDAPSATYLYLDKTLHDHGLFQAVCRVNRLDGEDKEYGYIIDYMDLFESLHAAFDDYTSGAFKDYDAEDVKGLLKNRLSAGRERLEDALERVSALCEPVSPPKDRTSYILFFCGDDNENPEKLKETEPRRTELYKQVNALLRAYADIADEMEEAGFTAEETDNIKKRIKQYNDVKNLILLASRDYVDLKKYEPAMRHLIDSYIGAEESRVLAAFDDFSLVDLIARKGIDGLDSLPETVRNDQEAVAEIIENNIRKVITEERPTNPAYFERMSSLLDAIIAARKQETIEYEAYLKKIQELAAGIKRADSSGAYPASIDTDAKRAFFDNLGSNEKLAMAIDSAIMGSRKDQWRTNIIKIREVRNAVEGVIRSFGIADIDPEYVVNLAKNQSEY